ncbi:hypothetical protein C6P40_002469 [Pichia californica]|uniref:Rpr2-domain-containing protein n=1 Tax=Pichia californica TaxID=460514 RepID=A0A9P6WHL8_9ASCO|nr:hypothetical protein C6P42_002762 [[Candida] californica]KAG0687354.1 hypothetical protein C6P40_002469 [[Candida] californica]
MEKIPQSSKSNGKEKFSHPQKVKKQNKQSKSNKSKTPRIPSSIPKKDHFQRVTYLYEVGAMMTGKQIENSQSKNAKSIDTISRMCLNHMNLVSKKAVLKLHPDIKRTICKKCLRLQVDGFTTKTRIKNDSKKQLLSCDVLEKECICGVSKRYPIGRDEEYTLFSEKSSVLFEMENK